MLRHLVELSTNMLHRSTCEAAHIKAQAQEVCIQKRGQERIAKQNGSKKDTNENDHFRVRHKAHSKVIILFHPSLNRLGQVATCRRRCAVGIPYRGQHGRQNSCAGKREKMEERKGDVGDKSHFT